MFSFEQKVGDGGRSGLSCPSMKELMIIGLIQMVFYYYFFLLYRSGRSKSPIRFLP